MLLGLTVKTKSGEIIHQTMQFAIISICKSISQHFKKWAVVYLA